MQAGPLQAQLLVLSSFSRLSVPPTSQSRRSRRNESVNWEIINGYCHLPRRLEAAVGREAKKTSSNNSSAGECMSQCFELVSVEVALDLGVLREIFLLASVCGARRSSRDVGLCPLLGSLGHPLPHSTWRCLPHHLQNVPITVMRENKISFFCFFLWDFPAVHQLLHAKVIFSKELKG